MTSHATYLHEVGDEEGEHDEGEAEDVEQRERHKSLLWRQSIGWVFRVFVDHRKGGKGHQSHLAGKDK